MAEEGTATANPTYELRFIYPSRSVYSLAFDRAGFLWAGTESDLLRGDGTRFESWLTKSPLPRNNPRVFRLAGAVDVFRRPSGDNLQGDAATIAARFEKTSVSPVKVERDWWHRLLKKLGTPVKYEYFVRAPAGYDVDKAKRWPLLVFLHGSGGGNKMQDVQTNGPQVPARQRKDFPFLVLSLRSPGGWYPPAVKDVLDEVAAKYRTDEKRTYLTGFSMGGMGTWEVLFDQPKRFAAASPVGGRRGHPERAAELKHVPIWVWNGAVDGTTTPADAKAAVEALKAVGGNVKYTEIPEAGHVDSHDFVFHGTELYDWLLAQRLP